MIKTDGLYLKEHTSDNLTKLYKWLNDEELLYFDDDEPFQPRELDDVRKYLENRLMKCGFADKQNIIHMGIHKHDGNMIGFCMIAYIDEFNKKCKLGLTIGDQSEWGKGYGTEVVEALVNYCFTVLGLNRIAAEIFSINERSIKIFENLGFSREGTLRNSVLKNGQYVDEYIYARLKPQSL